MNRDSFHDNKQFDNLIVQAIGYSVPDFDFERWKLKHSHEIQQYCQASIQSSLARSAFWNQVIQRGTGLWGVSWRRRILAALPITAIVFLVSVVCFMKEEPVTSVALADVIQRIQAVQTVRYHVVYDKPDIGQNACNVMVIEPDLARIEMLKNGTAELDTVRIVDLSKGLMLQLDPQAKQSLYVSINVGKDSNWKQTSELGEFYTLHNLRNIDEVVTEKLGRRQIDGLDVVGFKMVDPQRTETTVVWVDVKTQLPVRIERVGDHNRGGIGVSRPFTDDEREKYKDLIEQEAKKQRFSRETITNIEYDVELDESLFSLSSPEGYHKNWMQLPCASRPVVEVDNPEADVMLRGLKQLAEDFNGVFPSEEQLGEHLVQLNVGTQKERSDILQKAYMFLRERKAQYVGQGVSLGQADEMIAGWPLSNDGKTFRVIMGDLRIRDVDKNSEEYAELVSRCQSRMSKLQRP